MFPFLSRTPPRAGLSKPTEPSWCILELFLESSTLKPQLMKCGFAVVMITALAVIAEGASITLGSINSGVFQYELSLAGGESVVFNQGQQVNFTGLAGVIATSPSNIGFTSCGFTDNSACFAEIFTSETLDNSGANPSTYDLFTITSTTAPVAPVDYTVQATTPFSGQVDGPSAVPESGSGFLTTVGLIGLLWPAMRFFRRR